MNEPNLISGFKYKGVDIKVEWFDLYYKEDVPDLPWQQVYLIGNLDGMAPVVLYDDATPNLPGGHVESSENFGQTIEREIIEEINCHVVDWAPIGYQKLSSDADDKVVYQLRVYSELEKLGEFDGDIGGGVVGYKLVDISELNSVINYGEVGDRIIERVKNKFKSLD